MGDHAGPHYHSVDALSSNVLPNRERLVPPDTQPKPPTTKRRKINTCFPCKQRKVKCDRQHPYCGQCQKHRIPAERCVWSNDVMTTDMHPASALSFPKSDSAHTPIGLSAGDWAGAHGAELALDNDTRAVIERISHLEQRLAGASSSQPASHDMQGSAGAGQTQIDPLLLAGTTLSLGEVNTDRAGSTSLPQDATVAAELAFWRAKMEQHQRPPASAENPQMAQMQAEQNIAADALAMFARHSQQGALSGGDQSLSRAGDAASLPGASGDGLPRTNVVNAMLDSGAFPLGSGSSPSTRVRAALDMLPDTQQMDYLLKIFQTVDLHVLYGISWRLVRMQLTNLRSQMANWNRMHTNAPENVDLSFLSLLLVLLALAAQYTESRFFIEQGFCSAPDQVSTLVDTWVEMAQALMAMDDFAQETNLNHITALLLCMDYHASRGKLVLCHTAMAMLLRLAELQGYHALGSAKDDEELWSQSPASKQVCLSAVVGVPNSTSARADVAPKSLASLASSLPDRSHLVREAARRIWYKIACKDMALSAAFGRASSLDLARVTTKAPLNVDEEDLPDGETHVLPAIKADGRATINNLTPYLFQVADLMRAWSAHSADERPYEQLLDLDAKLRSVFQTLPIFLRPDPTLEQLPEVRQEQAQRPYLAMHRLIVFEAVNHRLLLLHREYMCRGHHDEKFSYSARAAVDAARTLISCRQQIDNVHPAVQRHAVFRHHLFQAAIVLTIHLLHLSSKSQGSSQVAHQLRDDIALIISYLSDVNDLASGMLSTHLPHPQKVALKLLHLLLAEDGDRRQSASADAKDNAATHSEKPLSHDHGSVGGIAIDGSNTGSLFQLAASTSPSSDSVHETAAAFASQLLDPDLGLSSSPTELFASLDELMVPIF
ncbi:hypothetical protein MSPP1_000762 [Malassezia sp. CBS 17886]|nr:hypothetical protein MSPP1_000762 [Malassezia sp. CBS 17886]